MKPGKPPSLTRRDLIGGATRFNDIHRGIPRMSPSLLSKRLKDLEAIGLIERRREKDRTKIEYHPTQAGLEVKPIIELFGAWGQRWPPATRSLAKLHVLVRNL